MKRRRYVIGILLCVTALLQAQDSVKSFDEFFVAGMDKIDGVFPVYVAEKEIYLEIPEKYIGREIEVSGQIDRGFDLLNQEMNEERGSSINPFLCVALNTTPSFSLPFLPCSLIRIMD